MRKVYPWPLVLGLMLSILALTLTPPPATAVSLEELERAQDEVEDKINRYQGVISSTEKKISSVTHEMSNLDQKIQAGESEIGSLEEDIALKEETIQGLEEDIVVTELGFADRQSILAQRARAIYEYGDVDFVEVMVSSTDMTDFLVRYELLSSLADSDMGLLDELEDQQAQLSAMKESLLEDQLLLQSKKDELMDSQTYLSSAVQDKKSLQKKLLTEKQLAQKALDEEKEANQKIERMIKDYIASQQQGGKYTAGKFAWPTPGYSRITSKYGWRIHPITKSKSMHTGVDIAAPRNAKIAAAAGGKVIYAAWYGAYGNCTIIDHGGGVTSMYGHQNKLGVRKGDIVTKGQQIGYVGTTGLSTGNHLHFEVRIGGNHTSPWPYLNGEK